MTRFLHTLVACVAPIVVVYSSDATHRIGPTSLSPASHFRDNPWIESRRRV